jgi:hypothetical protein
VATSAGIQLQGDSLAAHGLDFGDDGLRVLSPALVGEDDVAAAAGDAEGGVAAQAAAGAGDEGDSVVVLLMVGFLVWRGGG